MFQQFHRLLAPGCALALCLVAGVVVNVHAQTRRATNRPAAGVRGQRGTNSTRPSRTSATTEPEIQLERLPPDPSVENADFSITAHVKARSLRFDVVGTPTVTFFGNPDRDTVWEAQRENLPTPVEPGVSYRNIGIRLKITSVFRDIDRIVAEALGEVPVTDVDASIVESPKKAVVLKPESPVSQPIAVQPPQRERP